MKGEWVYNSDYYSKSDCDEIVKLGKEIIPHEAHMGFYNEQVDSEYRRTKIRWLDKDADQKFYPVYHEFWKFANKINHDWFNFNITFLPPLQFTEYSAQYKSEYKTHQDIFWINSTPRHRKLTLILQLSEPDEYEGGDLILETSERPPADAIRRKGTFIAFPSFVYHSVTPVTRGTRHSVVAWFEGPKFQ